MKRKEHLKELRTRYMRWIAQAKISRKIHKAELNAGKWMIQYCNSATWFCLSDELKKGV